MSSSIHYNSKVVAGITPVVLTDNTPAVSAICDRSGFLGDVEFLGVTGTLSDADTTITVLFEDGDASNLSDAAAVDDAYLLGVEAMSLRYDSDSKGFKIGYTGSKRYLRLTLTPANNTGNIPVAGVWQLHNARKGPQSTQIV